MKKIIPFLFVSQLALCFSCSQTEPVPEGCFKGQVVTGKFSGTSVPDKTVACDYAVQLEGEKIGMSWPSSPKPGESVYDNCVHIANLPEEYQKVGAVFYFRSYKVVEGPVCLAITISPPTPSIQVSQFFKDPCPSD